MTTSLNIKQTNIIYTLLVFGLLGLMYAPLNDSYEPASTINSIVSLETTEHPKEPDSGTEPGRTEYQSDNNEEFLTQATTYSDIKALFGEHQFEKAIKKYEHTYAHKIDLRK